MTYKPQCDPIFMVDEQPDEPLGEPQRNTIFLVDDNMANLTMGKEMLKGRYKVLPLPSAETMFDILKNMTPDLILLDIEMPAMDGYEAIRLLKNNPLWADIPVIFLTSRQDPESELQGLSLGAVDYVGKPFSAPRLLKRIDNHLLLAARENALKRTNESLLAGTMRKSQEVLALQNAIVRTMANLVEFRDDVTGGHIYRVQKYLGILLREVMNEGIYAEEIRDWDLELVLPSSQLHDLGKIGISDSILYKPDKLTPEEFEIMKRHVPIGVNAIKKISEMVAEHSFLRHARLFAGGHHEKWDGSGYPVGLSGPDIPLEGRLLAIADVYDALVSKRPYKKTISTADAKNVIISGAGLHFDPVLVGAFQKISAEFAEVVKKETY